MKSFLALHVQVDLFHEPVNHSPLPWAGISYTVSMSLMDRLRSVLRKDWITQLESATLSAVVAYYRRGIMKPTTIRLLLPCDSKAIILGVASHGPQTPSFWRRLRRLTPSGKRYEIPVVKRHAQPYHVYHRALESRSDIGRSDSAYARATYRV
jgi:hypothetical protein